MVEVITTKEGGVQMTKRQRYRCLLHKYNVWLQRDYNTAKLLRFSFKYLATNNKLNANTMDALCRLTWITKYRSNVSAKYVISTKLPALCVIFGLKSDLQDMSEVVRKVAIKTNKSPQIIRNIIFPDTGIVNLYAAYRNQVHPWIKRHEQAIRGVLRQAAILESDDEATNITDQLTKLPSVPVCRGGNACMSPFTILTPVITCLDPRQRFPIINKGFQLVRLLAELRLSQKGPADKFNVLLQLIGPGLCKDAFELDIMGDDVLLLGFPDKALLSSRIPKISEGDLTLRDERNIAVEVKSRWHKMRHIHNCMLRALWELYGDQAKITEGRAGRAKYDALIKRYNKFGHDLLIEVKSSIDIGSVRLAIGQLFDYRRYLKRNLATKLAIMLPEQPDIEVRSLLKHLGIHLLWFSSSNFKRLFQEDSKVFRVQS